MSVMASSSGAMDEIIEKDEIAGGETGEVPGWSECLQMFLKVRADAPDPSLKPYSLQKCHHFLLLTADPELKTRIRDSLYRRDQLESERSACAKGRYFIRAMRYAEFHNFLGLHITFEREVLFNLPTLYQDRPYKLYTGFCLSHQFANVCRELKRRGHFVSTSIGNPDLAIDTIRDGNGFIVERIPRKDLPSKYEEVRQERDRLLRETFHMNEEKKELQEEKQELQEENQDLKSRLDALERRYQKLLGE